MNPTIDAARRRVSLNPRDADFFNDPYPAYAAIRAETPAFFWEDYGFWCFASHADVSALLRDRRFGRQILHVMSPRGPGLAGAPRLTSRRSTRVERHSILELEPPEHTRLRNLVNRAFVSRQVEKLGPAIAALAHELIDAFEDRGSAELIGEFADADSRRGHRRSSRRPARNGGAGSSIGRMKWSRCISSASTARVEERAAAAAREFAGFVRAYARRRRADLGDDLISALLTAESEGGRLSEDELVSTVMLLLNAGHEATVHAIGNGVKAMLEQRLDAGRVFADERAVASTVEELLRLDPPLHLFTRYALEDVEHRRRDASARARRSASCSAPPTAIRFVFPDPDALDCERGSNPHVTFGAGIHFCVGAPLARLELMTALPILFRRLPGLRLAETPRYRDAFHFHGLESLRVEWR